MRMMNKKCCADNLYGKSMFNVNNEERDEKSGKGMYDGFGANVGRSRNVTKNNRSWITRLWLDLFITYFQPFRPDIRLHISLASISMLFSLLIDLLI